MPDAAYFRAWRAAHPDYRARQNQLRAERRQKGRGNRSAEYARRPSRAIPGLPPMHVGHVIFDRARTIVGQRRGTLTVLYDPLHDDLLSVATLALLEGRDAVEAVKRYRAVENGWRRITAPLLEAA